MKPPVFVTEQDALKASRKSGTWKPGRWYPSRIDTARETVSNAGNDCFELTHLVRNAAGDERTIRDWLVAVDSQMLKFKHAIESVGASEKYLAGEEITADDFVTAQDIEVKLAVERKNGFSRNVISDYRRASASVVNIRSVAKAVAFIGGVSLAALTGACSSVEPWRAQGSYVDPMRYQDYEQRYLDPPARNYAGAGERQSVPVFTAQQASSWQHDLGKIADGAALGAVGGTMANRAMAGRAAGQAVNSALPGAAGAVARGTETAAARAAAVGRSAAGASEALTAGRAVGAARAGAAAVGAAEALEGEALLGRALIWFWERRWLAALL